MAKVSSSLHDWAVNEMNYSGPWTEDMATLCTGLMGGVWEWIINHCKSKDKVKMIRGNLALARRGVGSSDLSINMSRVGSNNSGEGGEREELLAEKGKLMGDLHTVLAKIERLRAAVDQHNKDRLELSECMEDRAKVVKETQQRAVLLGLYLKQATNMMKKLDDLIMKLEKILERTDEKTIKVGRVYSSGCGVESESEKCVREAVKTGVGHFKSVFTGGSSKENKGDVRKKLVQLVGDLPSYALAESLVEQAVENTQQVQKKSENVDYLKDALAIQEEGNGIESVRKGVDEFYKKHVMSQMAVTNLKTSISKWHEKVTLAKDKFIGSRVAELDMEEVEKARQRGVASSLRSSMEGIKSNIAGLEILGDGNPDMVRMQQDQINDFCQIISTLLINNSVSSIESCQMSTIEIMTSTLPVLSSQVTNLSTSVKDNPSCNLTILCASPTSNLSSTLVGGKDTDCSVLTPVDQLIINRRKSTLPQLHRRINKREDTVDSLVRLMIEVYLREKEFSHALQQKGINEEMDELDRLERTLASSIREQGRNLGPLIDESHQMRLKASTTSAAIEKCYREWNTQPGGEVAAAGSHVWGEVEGRKLQQWVDLIRINLAKLYSNNNG